MIVTIKNLGRDCPQTEIKGHGWFPARPINYQCRTLMERLREAWMVFTGKADPFVWPEDSLDNDEMRDGEHKTSATTTDSL